MGRLNETPDGKPLPMLLEPHPGGRWFRDLGGDNGHLWGFVQSIKRPVLLEIWGILRRFELNSLVCCRRDRDKASRRQMGSGQRSVAQLDTFSYRNV